ncbi:MAG: hypothetical protein KKE86_04445, partial [Planctomycetes bacterium]|nr:hypothetical protein [Planctomycetota bacterium]
MKMSTVARGQSVLAGVWVLAIAIVLCGCPSAETKHDQKEPLRKQTDSTADPAAESRPESDTEKPPKTSAEPEALVTEAAVE